MKTLEKPTVVVFRMCPEDQGGDPLIALFPHEDATVIPGQYCLSYQHVGQHGGADYAGTIARTRPATPAEYADLAAELTRIGYNLKIQKRK